MQSRYKAYSNSDYVVTRHSLNLLPSKNGNDEKFENSKIRKFKNWNDGTTASLEGLDFKRRNMKKVKPPKTVEEYISGYPEEVQKRLMDIRSAVLKVIKKSAPETVEKIGYGMPSYSFKGVLLYYAAHINHIGFYPGPAAIEAFKNELAEYETSKGTIQFPYNIKIPLKLIAEIVEFRIRENINKEELKSQKKRSKK